MGRMREKETTKDKEEYTGTRNETDDGKWRMGGGIPHVRIFIKLNTERIFVPLFYDNNGTR